jgi:fibronectin-binding autotransporter adhesin
VAGSNPSGLPQTLLYDPADVTLQLSSNATPAPTPAPIVVAPTNDTIYTGVTSTASLTAQQANGIILDRIGNRTGGIADGQVPRECGPALQTAPADNATTVTNLASALPQYLAGDGAWFRGLGGFASINGSSTAPGFTAATGGYLWGPSLVTATAGYAHDWFDTDRGLAGIGAASESHGGNEATAAAQWSLPLTIAGYGGGPSSLTPKAGVQFVHLSESAFSETGASGFDLSSGSRGTDSFQPYIGAALAQKFVTDDGMLVTPEIRAGYAYETL